MKRPLLCGRSVVVLQEPTQPWTTGDRSVTPNCRGRREKQPVPHALMIPFVMIMSDELANRVAQRAFAHEDQSVQTRFLDRPYEALRVRVEIGRAPPNTARPPNTGRLPTPVLSKNSAERSGSAVIVAQSPAEPHPAANGAVRWARRFWNNQSIV